MANTFELISTVTVGAGGAASIDFTSIPQTYTDLQIVISARFNVASTNFEVYFNTSNANMSTRQLYGNGSSAASNGGAYSDYAYGTTNDSSFTANTFSNASIYIPNYTSANAKSFSIDGVTENNATTALSTIAAGLWNPGTQAAITSLKIARSSGNFVQYSTATLYGIKSGGSLATIS